MKLPNWQHHSKKEAKRTLKPQALRQAKKRRAALKAKLLASSVALVGFASPAQAITWGEFWEPFTDNHHGHVEHHHHHYGRPRPRKTCYVTEWKERWSYELGSYQRWRNVYPVPCRRHRHHH